MKRFVQTQLLAELADLVAQRKEGAGGIVVGRRLLEEVLQRRGEHFFFLPRPMAQKET